MLLDNIKEQCRKKGVSIWALERTLGLGNGVIGKWSHSSPSVENLKKVADFFGVTVDTLLR